MHPTSNTEAIRHALHRLGLHFPPKGIVAALAQQGIEVDEELVRDVRFEMLIEGIRSKVAKVPVRVKSPAVGRRPQGFPKR
jgi:hypothetical protein